MKKSKSNGKRGKKLKVTAAKSSRLGIDTVLENPLLKVVTDRANGAADMLMGKVKNRIAHVQESMTGVYERTASMQPAEVIAASRRYVRRHPLRSGLLFATLGIAAIAAFPDTKH